MNKGDIYQVTGDDGQVFTYTILAVDEDSVTFHSQNLGQSVTWPPSMVKRFMEVIGAVLVDYTLPNPAAIVPTFTVNKYKVFYINHGYYSTWEHPTLDRAIAAGKHAGFEFRVELGEMVCAHWSVLSGLRVMSEYQRWSQDQQMELARVAGEL